VTDDPSSKLKKELLALPDAVVAERMRALGFWPKDQPLPTDPIEEATLRSKLENDRLRLLAQASGAEKPEKALRRERIRRLKESQKRRSLKKLERLAAQKKRAEAWGEERRGKIVYAGDGVSAGLEGKATDEEQLKERGLPILHDATELAAALGISISRLRWLTFHRRGVTLVHYHRFGIPKKTGGLRSISAPKRDLKAAQAWIFEHVMKPLPVHALAHGFVPGRSILSNALPHVGKRVVLNLDVKGFFPSVGFRRVKGVFTKLGYGEQVATVLALLTTEPPRLAATLDGTRYWVALGDRALPQGACTSPAITNFVCRRLDARLAGLAHHFGFTYTRYADDLTFSGDDRVKLGKLLGCVRKVLESEGFEEHEDKTHVMGRGRRQEVTGVVVNEKPALPKDERRELRAILHNCQRFGLASQNRGDHPDFAAYLRGRVSFACMVDPSLGPKLWPALERALGLSR
jgi:RNA-directed DNA polymerase